MSETVCRWCRKPFPDSVNKRMGLIGLGECNCDEPAPAEPPRVPTPVHMPPRGVIAGTHTIKEESALPNEIDEAKDRQAGSEPLQPAITRSGKPTVMTGSADEFLAGPVAASPEGECKHSPSGLHVAPRGVCQYCEEYVPVAASPATLYSNIRSPQTAAEKIYAENEAAKFPVAASPDGQGRAAYLEKCSKEGPDCDCVGVCKHSPEGPRKVTWYAGHNAGCMSTFSKPGVNCKCQPSAKVEDAAKEIIRTLRPTDPGSWEANMPYVVARLNSLRPYIPEGPRIYPRMLCNVGGAKPIDFLELVKAYRLNRGWQEGADLDAAIAFIERAAPSTPSPAPGLTSGYVQVVDPSLDGNPSCHVCGAVMVHDIESCGCENDAIYCPNNKKGPWLCMSCGTSTLPSAALAGEATEGPEQKELQMELIPIGAARRSLFMSYDCAWNGFVRDVTAKLEHPGGLVSMDDVRTQIYKHCALLMTQLEMIRAHVPAPAAPEGADVQAAIEQFELWWIKGNPHADTSKHSAKLIEAYRGAVAEVRDLERKLITEATGHMKTQASLKAANERFMAEQDSRKAVEGEVRELRAKLALAEDYRDGWKRNCEAAVDMLRVLNEETVLTGFPGGDRNQTLANVREMRAQLTKAREALQSLVDSAVTDADMCAICADAEFSRKLKIIGKKYNWDLSAFYADQLRAHQKPSETKDGATEVPDKPA